LSSSPKIWFENVQKRIIDKRQAIRINSPENQNPKIGVIFLKEMFLIRKAD
jgi:hypothetical protein